MMIEYTVKVGSYKKGTIKDVPEKQAKVLIRAKAQKKYAKRQEAPKKKETKKTPVKQRVNSTKDFTEETE